MARVEVVLGDMFDGPSDLLLVPCSFVPTVTDFVARRLLKFQVPIPTTPIEPGDIDFRPLPASSTSIARFIGYAASVDVVGGTSSDVIRRIGESAADFCATHPEIGSVHAPLLGTGAGGVFPVASATALLEGFLATAPDSVLLRLFVIDPEQYELIRAAVSAGARKLAPAKKPVRVFVSYTAGAGAEHVEWVKSLAGRLRSDGLNARLDKWHLAHGMDLPQWMCNELDQADRVVLICDDLYAQKADRRHGGVGWEVRLVQGELMSSQPENPNKFIPIVVTPSIGDGTPNFLKATLAFHWPSRDERGEYDELVRAPYGAQESAPPIGQPPSFVLEALARSVPDV